MIDEITRQRILDTAQIVEVVSEFVQLKKRGSNYIGLCPFHNEKTPSFSVSESKGIYKCFGCGKAGNVVNFLMEHEKISYPDALRWLAKKYHIEIQEKTLTNEEIALQNERESIMIAIKNAHEFFVNSLHNTDEGKSVGLSYLYQRGFNDNVIKKFAVGYSPLYEKAFSVYAINKGFKTDILQKAGLINKGFFDNFTGRIIFPLYNLSGNVVGFTGRILSNEKSANKYFNSPETEVFHKGRLLFGLFQSKHAIVDKNKCYLVEGNMDVLAMHQSGIENAVASSGTALTVEQIGLIKRFTRNITILYDGDSAGIKAAMRAIDLLLQEGMNVGVVLLPDGHDPDSYSKAVSQNEFLQYLKNNEQDFTHFKSKVLLNDVDSDPIKRGNAIKDIVGSIALIPDKMLRSIFIKDTSNLFQIEESILYDEMNTLLLQKKTSLTDITYQKPIVVQQDSIQLPAFLDNCYAEEIEYEILRILLLYGNETFQQTYDEENNEISKSISVAEYIINDLLNDELEFKNLVYKQVFELINQQINVYKYIDIKPLISHENEQIREIVSSLLFTPYYSGKQQSQSDSLSKYFKRMGIYVRNEKEMLNDIISQLLLRYKWKLLEIAIKDTSIKLEKAQKAHLDEYQLDQLLQNIQTLTGLIKEISHRLNLVIRK